MGYPFDPTTVRARLLADDFGLDWQLKSLRESAAGPINLYRWVSGLGEIVRARVVGLAEDPRVQQMIQLTIDTLGPVDWAAERRRAVVVPKGGSMYAATSSLYNVIGACRALAIARWLQTGEPQTALFAEAFQTARDYQELAYAKKSKWRMGDIEKVALLGCAAHRFADVLAQFERPQLAAYKTLDLEKARSVLELAHAIALHRVNGMYSQVELDDLCERTLRREVVGSIELLIEELAALAYLVGLVREGDQRPLLDRMTDYVSYLAKAAKAKAKTRTGNKTPPPRVEPPPAPTRPLPPIILSSSPEVDRTLTRVVMASQPPQEWKQVDTPEGPRWALRIGHLYERQSTLTDPRFPDVIELSCASSELLSSDKLPRLVRATADGKTLSKLAARATPCPLEVAFPRVVGNWIDAAMIQVNPPLSRGHWRHALAIGALTNLRALSFDACEDDKQRIVRGDEPYTIGPSWFWSAPLTQQLEALNVSADLHPLRGWRVRFDELPRLSRVYLLVWVRQRTMPWRRPLRIVIDRAPGSLRITLQCAVSLCTLVSEDFATLFDGLGRDHASVIDVEQIRSDITDTVADIAALLTTDVPIGELRGDATLAEL